MTTTLIISRDAHALDLIAATLTSLPSFQIQCTSNIDPWRNLNPSGLFDIVILDVDGWPGASMPSGWLRAAGTSLVLATSEANLPSLVQSFSGLAVPILLKPIDAETLVEIVQGAKDRREKTHRLALKYRQMRELVRRVIRERRDLNSRIELVCRDLVDAHRRLSHRFVEMQKAHPQQP